MSTAKERTKGLGHRGKVINPKIHSKVRKKRKRRKSQSRKNKSRRRRRNPNEAHQVWNPLFSTASLWSTIKGERICTHRFRRLLNCNKRPGHKSALSRNGASIHGLDTRKVFLLFDCSQTLVTCYSVGLWTRRLRFVRSAPLLAVMGRTDDAGAAFGSSGTCTRMVIVCERSTGT